MIRLSVVRWPAFVRLPLLNRTDEAVAVGIGERQPITVVPGPASAFTTYMINCDTLAMNCHNACVVGQPPRTGGAKGGEQGEKGAIKARTGQSRVTI
jgi:hypothetical protein